MKKRKDGRYETTVNINGKTKHIYGETQKEVRQKVAEIKMSLGQGFDLTLDDSLGYWIDMYINTDLNRYTGVAKQAKIIHLTLFKDKLGSFSLQSIKPSQIEAILRDLANYNPYKHKPSSKNTLSEYIHALSAVYKMAIKNRVISFNPCDFVQLPETKQRKHRRALTKEEIEKIENYDADASDAAIFAIYTGLRRGEQSALLWEDVDLKNHTITVNKAYSYHNKELKLPKSNAGIRTVPINDKVEKILQKTPVSKRKGYVFKQGNEMLGRNDYRKYLSELLYLCNGEKSKILSIEPFTWHCFRHTFATLLYEKNIPVKVAQEWLGHADFQTTMNIYTHLSKDKELSAYELWK